MCWTYIYQYAEAIGIDSVTLDTIKWQHLFYLQLVEL